MNQREREICARVKQFRELVKWSQPAFASEIGLTKDQLTSIEYQRTPLRYFTGYHLCLIFEVSPEWLATGKGPADIQQGQYYPVLPTFPKKVLFSEVFDNFIEKVGSSIIAKTKSVAEKELGSETKSGVPPLDDPTGFFMERLLDVLRGAKFENSNIRDQFIFDVVKTVEDMALDYHRKRVKTQVRLGANFDPKEADLSRVPMAKFKKFLALKGKIKDLHAEVMMIQKEFPEKCGIPADIENPPPRKPPPV